ncbi:MAG: hypothetical protein IMF05_03035 [Proteobacteria bacterium]|nr:hypothetical protein [Pseudomonadota bacterium]
MIDASKVRPARGLCVIQMDEVAAQSPGGIWMPSLMVSDKPSPNDIRGQNIGTVTAIGPPKWDASEELYDEADFAVGDRVRFHWAKTEVLLSDRHWIVPQKDVILKVGVAGLVPRPIANGRPAPSPSPGAP